MQAATQGLLINLSPHRMPPPCFMLAAIMLLVVTAVPALGNPVSVPAMPDNQVPLVTARPSCMVRWITQSGVEQEMAEKYEGIFKSIGMSETKLVELDTDVLAFLMGMTDAHATMLKSCLDGTNPLCAGAFDPCNTEGECAFNTDSRSYMCQCQPGRTGHYCEDEIDECGSEPCQNGGRCVDAFNSFSCNCSVGYEGDLCQTRWLTLSRYDPIPETLMQLSYALQSLNASLEKEKAKQEIQLFKLQSLNASLEEEKAKVKSQGIQLLKLKEQQKCNPSELGFVYSTDRTQFFGARQVARATIKKKQSSTVLHIAYTTNIRTYGKSQTQARWYALIDGRECSSPNKVDMVQNRNNNAPVTYSPAHLEGICRRIGSGNIAAGYHTITIDAGPRYQHFDALTGYDSTSTLQVREICA
ncbi:uncharacterized protein LOC135825598 isoform X2 [Sycon ciliatum]|uniref:uncharacterized protein LOC135825598 isoform X2 n=1 Tax=Sycon ciliatum TaxID=27933 RepID=UPI0031F68828